MPSQRDGVDNVGMQYVTICAGQGCISVSREESGPRGAPRLCPDRKGVVCVSGATDAPHAITWTHDEFFASPLGALARGQSGDRKSVV